MRTLIILLCVGLAGCAFAFQDRPRQGAKCSSGRGLAAVDGFATVASFAVATYAITDEGFPLRMVTIPVAAVGIAAFGASSMLGWGWADRCRRGGGGE